MDFIICIVETYAYYIAALLLIEWSNKKDEARLLIYIKIILCNEKFLNKFYNVQSSVKM